MKFVFLRHWAEEDAKILEESIKKCDVFSPEMSFWDKERLTWFRKFGKDSNVRETILNLRELEEIKSDSKIPGYHKKILELVFQHNKPTVFVDVENILENIPLRQKEETAGNFKNSALFSFQQGDFNKAAEKIKDYLSTFTDFQIEREKIIKKNIKELSPQLLKEYPELKKKETIRILLTYGGTHTPLFHQLKKELRRVKEEGKEAESDIKDVQRQFPESPYFYPFSDELFRRLKFHKEKFNKDIEITDEEAIKYILEPILLNYFEKMNQKPLKDEDETSLGRFFLEKINRADINELEKYLKEDPLRQGKKESIIGFFREKRGLPLPENKEELEELIKQLKPENRQREK